MNGTPLDELLLEELLLDELLLDELEDLPLEELLLDELELLLDEEEELAGMTGSFFLSLLQADTKATANNRGGNRYFIRLRPRMDKNSEQPKYENSG
ncbi:MAG: hypothetical protein EOO68_16705 [Moraxellaceae bacterium]|nr:MAG: hypothetical protein EOO68_16705 [Moraxellaceae bacterium]